MDKYINFCTLGSSTKLIELRDKTNSNESFSRFFEIMLYQNEDNKIYFSVNETASYFIKDCYVLELNSFPSVEQIKFISLEILSLFNDGTTVEDLSVALEKIKELLDVKCVIKNDILDSNILNYTYKDLENNCLKSIKNQIAIFRSNNKNRLKDYEIEYIVNHILLKFDIKD